jgi:hypothetical protein
MSQNDSSTRTHDQIEASADRAPKRRPDLAMAPFMSGDPVEDPGKDNPTILEPWTGHGWIAQS